MWKSFHRLQKLQNEFGGKELPWHPNNCFIYAFIDFIYCVVQTAGQRKKMCFSAGGKVIAAARLQRY